VLASTAMAGMENCRFALHRQDYIITSKLYCTTNTPNATATPCQQYVTTSPGTPGAQALIYMVIAHAGVEGVSGASFGITYSTTPGTGVSVVSVTYCATGLPFPNDGGHGEFPAPGGGVRVTWLQESCATTVIGTEGVHAIVGALYTYAYGPDQMSLTPNRNLQSGIPELSITDCQVRELDLVQLYGVQLAELLCGRVDFGGGLGYNPCFVVPAAPTTWGKIKSQYTD